MLRISRIANEPSVVVSLADTERSSKMKAVVVVFLAFTLIAMSAYADTQVIGFISQDTTWTKMDSPYVAVGHVIVQEGVTLTIEPGVLVDFGPNHSLKIEGILMARGTETDNIIFTSQKAWEGIVFEDSSVDAQFDENDNYLSGSILQHSVVEFAQTGIKGNSAAPHINHCIVSKNSGTGIYIQGKNVQDIVISDSVVTDNGTAGICVLKADAISIQGNIVSKNGRELRYRNGGGIYISAIKTVDISDNTLTKNISRQAEFFSVFGGARGDGAGIYISGSESVTITGNFLEQNEMSSRGASGHGFGGGIYVAAGKVLDISDNTLSGHEANHGGGIYASGIDAVTIERNTIRSNRAFYYGGGIYASGIDALTISKNMLVGNSIILKGDGGGIYTSNNNKITISENTFTENVTYYWLFRPFGGSSFVGSGGAVCTKNAVIMGNTFDGNLAASGGGVHLRGEGEDAIIKNNAFTENMGNSGASIYYSGSGELTGNIITGSDGKYAVLIAEGNPKFNENALLDNRTEFDLYFGARKDDPDLDATNNYWGATTEAKIRGKIYDFFQNEARAFVNVVPFLTEPPPIVEETWKLIENKAPVASFTFSPESPAANEEIVFDASGSSDPDGEVVSYEWNFGDGATASEQVAKHLYSSSGTYLVSLEVTDDDGATAKIATNITVTPAEPPPNQSPVASFTFSPESPVTNEQITLDASGSYDPDGQIVSFEWDFGDGVTENKQVITCSYATEGQYVVTLEVIDDTGGKISASKQVEVTSIANLEALINAKLLQMPIYPLYLLDMESFLDQVNTKWQNFTAWLLPGNSVDDYDELFCTGIEYDSLRYMSLIRARDFLNAGDVGNAKEYLKKSDTYEEMSQISFQGAAHVFDASSEAAEIIAQSIKDGCQASVKFGLKVTSPTAAKGADFLYDVLDLGIKYYLGNEEEAVRDFLLKRAVKLMFDEVPFDKLGGETVSDWIKDQTGEYIFPMLVDVTESLEWDGALSILLEESVEGMVREELIKITDLIGDEAAKVINFGRAALKSPADIRVYDSEGRVTGLVDGKVMNEIPGSVYNNESVIIFFPTDVYRYEVAGTEDGEYGLEVISTVNGDTSTFVTVDIPISAKAVHQYSVDWDNSEKMATIQVDDNGDGIPEHTVVADSELTSKEYLSVVGVTPHDRQVITWGALRKTELLQNYPNPFNPETWIPYQLAGRSEVTIRISSVTGELVRKLELGDKPSGLYIGKNKAAYWDGVSDTGEQVASGIYFYTFQAGEFIKIKKMIVLR